MNIIKKYNEDISLLLTEQTSNILFKDGIPDFSELFFEYDEHLKRENDCVIIGTYNKYDIIIELPEQLLYILFPDDKMFLNSSLLQFVNYINIYKRLLNREILSNNAEQLLLMIDENAFNDKDYFWGAWHEEIPRGF